MSMSTISIRVDSNDKSRFESFCNNTGLNISTAINMYIKAVLQNNEIPFKIKDEIPVSNDIPNEITAASIAEGDRLAYDSSCEGFTDMKSLKKSLGL